MGTLPALIPFQMPQNQFNLGDTYVQMAKIKALQQQARLDELKIGAQEREASQDALWKSVMAGVYTPEGGSGLAAPAPPQAPPPSPGGLAAAQAGPVPQSPTAMLAQAGVQVPPVDTSQPALMNPSMVQAPQGAPPPSLATAQAPAPAQAAPPPGGLAQGGKTRPAFQGLMQPMNERALVEAHKINPERTEKWFTGMMKMQGDRIEQTKKQNDMVYRVLKAVDASPNPAAYWPEAVESLKRQGIPVPPALETYNPAMLAFKLNEHRSADVELTEAQTQHQQQLASTANKLGIKYEAETRGVLGKERREEKEFPLTLEQKRAQIQEAQAGTQYKLAQTAREKQARGLDLSKDERDALHEDEWRKGQQQERQFKAAGEAHEARMRPLKQEELTLKNQLEQVKADFARPEAERKAATDELDRRLKANQVQQAELGVPQYLKDDADTNTALNQVKKQAGTEGQPPSGKEIEDARNLVIQGKVQAAASHGRDAAQAAVIQPILTDAVAKGQIGEQMHGTLDEIEDLVYRGALSSSMKDQFRMVAQSLGMRPDDDQAAREWALRQAGERMRLATLGGKLGGQISDTDAKIAADAAGAFDRAQSPAQRKEALRAMRGIADRNVEFGNRHITQYNETKTLPKFGTVRDELRAKTITREKLDEAIRAKPQYKGREEELLKWFESQGYKIRVD